MTCGTSSTASVARRSARGRRQVRCENGPARDSEPMRRAILFLHVRRTGGISLLRLLSTRFAVDECRTSAHAPERYARDPSPFRLVEGHVDVAYAGQFRHPPFIYDGLREQDSAPALARRVAGGEAMRRHDLHDFVVREPALAAEFLGNAHARTLGDPAPSFGQERLDEATPWLGSRLGSGPLGPMPRDNPAPGRPPHALGQPDARRPREPDPRGSRAVPARGRARRRRLCEWRGSSTAAGGSPGSGRAGP
jgi:hypothetical protein